VDKIADFEALKYTETNFFPELQRTLQIGTLLWYAVVTSLY